MKFIKHDIYGVGIIVSGSRGNMVMVKFVRPVTILGRTYTHLAVGLSACRPL